MEAVIISIGNELLNGKTVNTNATYIAEKLFGIGIPTKEIITVGDNRDDILEALKAGLKKADLVITTGGLGPTHDDITKKVIAEFFETSLIVHEKTMERMKRKFEARGSQMPQVNINQALVPENAEILENPLGTAPGLRLEKDGKQVIVLPGVPREMEAILESAVLPHLRKKMGESLFSQKLYRTTGIAESRIYEICRDLFERHPSYEIAFLPKYTGVDLRIILKGPEARDEEGYQKFEKALYDRIGKYIYATRPVEIEEVVGELLRKRGLTLSVAESCTGGLVQDRITNVAGSSDYFLGGMVTYSNESKHRFLGVSEQSLKKYGAVSDVVAKEMASGARGAFETDIAVSTTGIAGPTGATPQKPVGLIFIGLATPEGVSAYKFIFVKNRRLNKLLGSQAAIELIRRYLLGIPSKNKLS